MNQTNQRPPYLSILSLALIGAGATVFAFWLVDHRQAVPNSMLEFAGEQEGTRKTLEHAEIDQETSHNYQQGWRTTFMKLETSY